MDTVILTVPQIIEEFGLSNGAVRAWIAAGLIQPVRREGRGRSGMMYFTRGEVVNLVYASCQVCGERFKKGTLKQRFCSKSCRQKFSRMHPRDGANSEA